MLLKFIIFAIVAGIVYRFIGGKLPFIDRGKSKKKDEHEFGEIEATSACSYCSIYITEDDAIIHQKKTYCSNECLEKAKIENKKSN